MIERRSHRPAGYFARTVYSCVAGSLLQFDVSDQFAPIGAIRDQLMVDRESLRKVHHDRFEKVVAEVYKDLGYDSIATASSGDDGIDVILAKGETHIGIQVKRYQIGCKSKSCASLPEPWSSMA